MKNPVSQSWDDFHRLFRKKVATFGTEAVIESVPLLKKGTSVGARFPLPPWASRPTRGLTAPAGLHHHVRYVRLDNVAVPVIIQQRQGAPGCGHAA